MLIQNQGISINFFPVVLSETVFHPPSSSSSYTPSLYAHPTGSSRTTSARVVWEGCMPAHSLWDYKVLLWSHKSFPALVSVPSSHCPVRELHQDLVPQVPPQTPEIPQGSGSQCRSPSFFPSFPLACCGCQDNHTVLQL